MAETLLFQDSRTRPAHQAISVRPRAAPGAGKGPPGQSLHAQAGKVRARNKF